MELLFTFSQRNKIIRSVFQFIRCNFLGDAFALDETKNKTGGYFLPSCAVPIFIRSTIGLAQSPLRVRYWLMKQLVLLAEMLLKLQDIELGSSRK